VHEERHRPCALLGVVDVPRGGLDGTLGWQRLLGVHDSPLSRRRRGRVRFLQLPRTLVAAHFDDLAAELDLDGIFIQLAVASRTGFLFHDIALQ
jgi:hypothetical protein